MKPPMAAMATMTSFFAAMSAPMWARERGKY
jgi:hypothetical protein